MNSLCLVSVRYSLEYMGEYSVRRMSFSRMNFENLFMKVERVLPNSKFDFARIETAKSHRPRICPTQTVVLSFVQ